jgi:hypothetical protein
MMLVVKVELHSERTGLVSEIARMEIVNDGTGKPDCANYNVRTLRGLNAGSFDQRVTQRDGRIENWKRKNWHVWKLVACALQRCGYGFSRRGMAAQRKQRERLIAEMEQANAKASRTTQAPVGKDGAAQSR